MVKYSELQIGDYILVDGKPRRVESITKKKIGYHINPQTDKRLYYARLRDVVPIKIDSVVVRDWNTVTLQFENCGFLLSGFVTIKSNDSRVLYFEFPTGDTAMYCPFCLHHAHHLAKAFNYESAKLERLILVKDE